MAQGKIDFQGVHFEDFNAASPNISPEVWQGCFSLGVAAVSKGTDANQATAYATTFMGGDAKSFQEDCQDPQQMADKGRLNPQTITDPRLIVAFGQSEPGMARVPVSFALSGDVVTGSESGQRIKAMTGLKSWRTLLRIATHPDWQGRGIASGEGYMTFRTARLLSSAAGYTHPSQGESGARLLKHWGMPDDGGRQEVRPYGPHGPVVTQHRHAGLNARLVAHSIAQQAGESSDFQRLVDQYSPLNGIAKAFSEGTDPNSI